AFPRGTPSDLRVIHHRPILARTSVALRRIVGITGNDHVVVMHFEQSADEGEALEAAGDPVAHGIADLEALGIEVELERAGLTCFAHSLHRNSPLSEKIASLAHKCKRPPDRSGGLLHRPGPDRRSPGPG